ncbi:MAG: lipoprotein signal peptidase [Marinilabiliales bacterium]|nr:lipoprotein signal peptidase [Marinilabiliales bacterium]
MSLKNKSLLLIFLILLADQILKIYIKTHFYLGEEVVVAKNWFIIHFVENNGMAFGFEFGDKIGKYFLSIFRIAAIGALGWYLTKLWKKGAPVGVVVCFSLILAGAAGNLIDSAFYGLIFNDSHNHMALFLPTEGGYGSFLMGKVVDMFYFPLIESRFPEWFPFWGGQEFIFFRPVFNLADASISVGIVALFAFYRSYFDDKKEQPSLETEGTPSESTTEPETTASEEISQD